MTPSELKYLTRETAPFFFTRDTMRVFGDTMRNYGVRSARVLAEFDGAGNHTPDGTKRDAWELYRKRAVKHGLSGSAFFDKVTFEQIHCILEVL